MQIFCYIVLSLFLYSSGALADVVYPIGGPLSNAKNEKVDLRNFSCGVPDKKIGQVECSQTVTTIKPKLEGLFTIAELEAIAKRDNFDLKTLEDMCSKMEPFFSFMDGKSMEGQTVTPEHLKNLEQQSAAMGFEANVMLTIRSICDAPSQSGIIKMLDEMQKAESRVCKVNSWTSSGRPYKFDSATGNFIWSEVVNGMCDQYVYTEIMTLDEFGMGVITRYEEKRTFVQKLLEGDRREALPCDGADEYDDKVYTQNTVYFPLKCVSFVRD